MTEFVESALFVFDAQFGALESVVVRNPFGVPVTPVEQGAFFKEPERFLSDCSHVVVAASLADIKTLLQLSMKHGFSVGLIPSKAQKSLRSGYGLPQQTEGLIKLALSNNPTVMDLILCNREIMLFSATVGHLPLLDVVKYRTRLSAALSALPRMLGLRLRHVSLTTATGRKIETAACGCMIVQRHGGTQAARLIAKDSSFVDGMISLVIAAPMSVLEYMRFIFQFLMHRFKGEKTPSTLGYIKSSQIDIDIDARVEVLVDGEGSTHTPLHCEVLPGAVRVNVGSSLSEKAPSSQKVAERIDIKNLPAGRELKKARNRIIPFFAYASDARFKDLYTALREDSNTTSLYVVLMVLSTLLATLGLFLSSASVVIGAMLLAPLMAPIGSLSMGLVRQDDKLTIRSIRKILVGVIIALLAAATLSLMIAHKPVTAEMEARLNPSLLDLGVAILAGVAAALAKSYKEILQSLAGVAIAVALVPPLAVAGIGLGRADFVFFSQAFLLFLTNLVGIAVAAALTFRILGYSPVVQNKRGLAVITVLLALVSVPLYFSYQAIVKKQIVERSWKKERFLVHGKYLIVQKANLIKQKKQIVLYVDVLAREPLTRDDLAVFKERIQTNFEETTIVRAKVSYIL